MKLLVVLINYRTAEMTLRSLESVLPELDAIPGSRVALVDNDSGDGSADILAAAIAERGWKDRVELIRSPRNGGFAYGVNLAVRPALAGDDPPELVYLLNSDAFPDPGSLRVLVDFLDASPDVGIAGSQIYGTDGELHETAFRFHSIPGELTAELGGLALANRWLDPYVVAMPLPTQDTRVDWLAGASMLIRARVFHDAGLFDERFFLYYEEADFCRRAALAGWRTGYVPGSRVAHVGSASTGWKNWSQPRPDFWFESRRYYWRKNAGLASLWAADLAWLLGLVIGRCKGALLGREDTRPPRLLRDFVRHMFRAPPRLTAPARSVRDATR